MKNILVAVDATTHSHLAVELASEIAKLTGADLTVALVYVAQARAPFLYALEETEAARIVDEATSYARRAGVPKVTGVVLSSREAAAAIVHYAEANGFDRIFTGTGVSVAYRG